MTALWPTALAIFRKDLRAELRSRELVASMALFAALCVLTFSFALELDREARESVVSGVLWVTVTFSAILGLNRSLSGERESSGLDAVLLAPIPRASLYLGKLLANFSFTLAVSLIFLPVMTLLYNQPLLNPWLVVVLALGAFGLTSVGTLLAAMTVQTRARDALLPIVMLPTALPALLAAVNATNALINEADASLWQGWLALLLVIDIFYAVFCALLFRYVVEE
ncbi:MAG: heme exporter protein CcmB [Anaerolineae bacterium]|jgi:heme exporter protein B|nr:heme exporter protein CcmB [Anaerolineae bacterium]